VREREEKIIVGKKKGKTTFVVLSAQKGNKLGHMAFFTFFTFLFPLPPILLTVFDKEEDAHLV